MRLLVAAVMSVALAMGSAVKNSEPPVRKFVATKQTATKATFSAAGDQAFRTLIQVYYAGNGAWRACDSLGCPTGDIDWGYDSLTYTLALRMSLQPDPSLVAPLRALAARARSYPAPCQHAEGCPSWSDVPEWDAVALADEYQNTGDPATLAKAQAAYAFVQDAAVFALGACPAIPYQKPGGGQNHLKTLETEANAIKAALLIYRATRDTAYLDAARAGYAAVRFYFLDRRVPLYSVYLFDDGRTCRQLPHRFFASVNGDMIWSGIELSHDTGDRSYLTQATDTAGAVERHLSDARGIFANLQAENDVAEPLVEAMAALAQPQPALPGQHAALDWVIRNARAALSARTPDGSFGRFFDGPPPVSTVTAWQTNGGLSLEIAAAWLARDTGVGATRGLDDRDARAARGERAAGDPALPRIGDRPARNPGRAVLRARARTRAHRRPRDLRRIGHLAEQVEPAPEHPGHDPLRVEVAHGRLAHAHLPAGRPERQGGRVLPAPLRLRASQALSRARWQMMIGTIGRKVTRISDVVCANASNVPKCSRFSA